MILWNRGNREAPERWRGRRIRHLRARPFPLLCLYLFPRSGNEDWTRHHRLQCFMLRERARPLFLFRAIAESVPWYFFYLWRNSIQTVRKRGKAVKAELHLSRFRQWAQAIRLHLCYQIPIRCYYEHHLYREENRQHLHERFFNHLLPDFHDYCNRNNARFREERRLLADKLIFAQRLEKAGFPCARTFSLINNPSQSQRCFQKQTVFCKPQSGSQSRNAFLLKYDAAESRYRAFPIQGKPILTPAAIEAFLRSKSAEPMLVQEALADHPEIAALSGTEEITTLRLVTGRFRDGSCRVLHLQLELPIKTETAGSRKPYRIYPLELPALEVSEYWIKNRSDQAAYDPLPALSAEIRKLLREACELGLRCHETLFQLHSVGFDFALTERGPVFIEGNYNWSIESLFLTNPDLSAETSSAAPWLKEQF